MMSRAGRALLFLAGIALLLPVANAQKKSPVGLQLLPMSVRGRSGSPIPLQIKLEYNSPQMLEGDLLLEIYNSYISPDELIATIRYDGLVLQGNDYFISTILPPFEHSHNQLYQIVAWFDTDKERLSLSSDPDDPGAPHDLLSIGSYERATLTCSVSGARDFARPGPNRNYLGERLALDNYNPGKPGNQPGRIQGLPVQTIQHYTCSRDALSLPEDPLHLCCFDLILLADGALGRLENSQISALKTWVAAGGSLAVLPDDDRLKGNHIQFLQDLFERPDEPEFSLTSNDDGTLLVISNETNPIVNRRFGLGRVTLLPNVEDLSLRLRGAELHATVCHLWKLGVRSPIRDGRPWSLNQHIELYPQGSLLTSACEVSLMPEGVQMVPPWVIAALLIAYVIAIGPVDYFVLGFFRARKYTWILFPVLTAGFTALTVYIAHDYIAATDTGGRLSVVDVLDDGTAIRQTDLEMHFYGAQTNLTRTFSSQFAVSGKMTIGVNQFSRQTTPNSTDRIIRYSGRFPQAYDTVQDMKQWSPQLNRIMTLNPEVDVPKIDWSDSDLVTTPAGRRKLNLQLRRLSTDSREVDAVIVNGLSRIPLFNASGFAFSNSQLTLGQNWFGNRHFSRVGRPPRDAISAFGVMQASVRSPSNDYFHIVYQQSPQGSAALEDLPLIDMHDPSHWLLIVAVKEGQTTRFFRHPYHVTQKVNGR